LAQDSCALADDSLSAGRWRQAAGLSQVERAFATTPETVAHAQVNIWIARDRGVGIEEIRSEVAGWDTSGLPTEFRLAQLILLHRDEQALRLLRDMTTEGPITRDALATWPLFHRLRESGLLVARHSI
jgi:hypothetical protein